MKVKIGLCQIGESTEKKIEDNKAATWKKAEAAVREAAKNGAQIVALPEMWNCPYITDYFRDYAEKEDGDTVNKMSKLAAELGIYLIGGSIPENDSDRIYNTSFIFDRNGKLIGRHRKTHLFDINIEGAISFKESDVLSPGDGITVVDTEYGKIGVAICYDIRFPEFFRKMELAGAKAIFLPAAFNLKTGPAHWDLLMRARAMDNQLYMAAVSPARVEGGIFTAYGFSCIVDPWGEIKAQADESETIIYGEVDTDFIDEKRRQMPFVEHRRPELY